jgi:hypothetical protein
MKKNPGENFGTIEVNPINGNYYIELPEWIINEFEWYEGTEINIEVDNHSIFITEID